MLADSLEWPLSVRIGGRLNGSHNRFPEKMGTEKALTNVTICEQV
jgi:hypothetical protein